MLSAASRTLLVLQEMLLTPVGSLSCTERFQLLDLLAEALAPLPLSFSWERGMNLSLSSRLAVPAEILSAVVSDVVVIILQGKGEVSDG